MVAERTRVSAAIDPIISRAVWTGTERGKREGEDRNTAAPAVCNMMIIDQGKERGRKCSCNLKGVVDFFTRMLLAIVPAKLLRLFAEKHDGFNVLMTEGI